MTCRWRWTTSTGWWHSPCASRSGSSSSGSSKPPADERCELEQAKQDEITALDAKLEKADFYASLDIARDADKKTIKRAYFAFAAKYHPDRFFGKKLGKHIAYLLMSMFVAHVTLSIFVSGRSLLDMVREGKFREDLYYRLNVVPLRMPNLRERRDDVAALSAHFLKRAADAMGLATRALGEDALAVLQSYNWPGNVRQLRNVMEWLIIMAQPGESGEIMSDALPPERQPLAPEDSYEVDGRPVPRIFVSARTGQGLERLRQALARTLHEHQPDLDENGHDVRGLLRKYSEDDPGQAEDFGTM